MGVLGLFLLLGSVSIDCGLSISQGAESVSRDGASAAGVTIEITDPSAEESGRLKIPYKIAEFVLRNASPESRIAVNDIDIEMKALRKAIRGRRARTTLSYEDGSGHLIEIQVVRPGGGKDAAEKD